MEGLHTGILGAISKSERNVHILNKKMSGLDKVKDLAKYERYESRLNKSKSLLAELKAAEEEMGLANRKQMARAHFFRKAMDRAEENASKIIAKYDNGNLSLDEMQSQLNSLKNDIIGEMDRLLPYKKVTESIGGKALIGLKEFNENSAKIASLYKKSITSFSERINKYNEIEIYYESNSEIIILEPQPLVPVDVLNQQMSAFESQSDGSTTSIDEQIKQSIPVGYCFGKTLMCGANPTCGGRVTFA